MITKAEYAELDRAYQYFNDRLFSGSLPPVLITLQRNPRARGYFSPDRFNNRKDEKHAHELALNPDVFEGRTDEDILSTLVHEMVHVWQQEHGRPPRRCYHDKQWAGKMKEVGLYPSDSGAPDGKETGQNMSHYIVPRGPFQCVCGDLLRSGFELKWQSPAGVAGSGAKAASKTKFTCPVCEQNAWAKADSKLICGVCYEQDEKIQEMEASE